MWHHAGSLLLRSWSNFTAALGSNTLGFISPFLVALVGVLLYAAVLLWREGWRAVIAHFQQRLKLAALVAIAAEIVVYAPIFVWNVANTIYMDHEALVAENRALNDRANRKKGLPPYNNNLRIIRFERSPYEVGKPIFINLYYRYDGDNPARLRGYYKVIVAHLDDKDQNPIAIESVEEALWKTFIEDMKSPDHGILISPKSNGWFSLFGPAITAEQIDELTMQLSGLVLFMGQFRWLDELGDYETDFCAFTQANPEVFISCTNHNGPVRPTGDARIEPTESK